jgi:regulator of cell morphogenesis and NO signaling
MSNIKDLSLGDIVSDDFRTASIFTQHHIDFCCGGKMSLSEACTKEGVNLEKICREIEDLTFEAPDHSQNFKEWDPGFLCDYIVNTHHKFVQKHLPELRFYTQKISDVHGDAHAELKQIAEIFAKVYDELIQHLKNEEEVLFPAIKKALASKDEASVKVIHSEIERMNGEHEFAGGSMDEISRLSKRYELPKDACQTYELCYKLLEKFENDLHIHVHLENNILFPKALKL